MIISILLIIVTALKDFVLLLGFDLASVMSFDREKFKHSFKDAINPLFSCGNDIESSEELLLHCPYFVNE